MSKDLTPSRSLGKAAIYAEAGVEEYWIVLPAERRVEVHRCPRDGSYLERSVVEGDAVLACAGLAPVREWPFSLSRNDT